MLLFAALLVVLLISIRVQCLLSDTIASTEMLLLVNFSRVFQVVSAVIYVHDQGLIHRDLKPSNVLFSLDGTVKVGDFGLVTDAHSVYDDVAVLDVNLATSRHTEKVGTRMYMAPEQVTL